MIPLLLEKSNGIRIYWCVLVSYFNRLLSLENLVAALLSLSF